MRAWESGSNQMTKPSQRIWNKSRWRRWWSKTTPKRSWIKTKKRPDTRTSSTENKLSKVYRMQNPLNLWLACSRKCPQPTSRALFPSCTVVMSAGWSSTSTWWSRTPSSRRRAGEFLISWIGDRSWEWWWGRLGSPSVRIFRSTRKSLKPYWSPFGMRVCFTTDPMSISYIFMKFKTT